MSTKIFNGLKPHKDINLFHFFKEVKRAYKKQWSDRLKSWEEALNSNEPSSSQGLSFTPIDDYDYRLVGKQSLVETFTEYMTKASTKKRRDLLVSQSGFLLRTSHSLPMTLSKNDS